MSFFIIIKLNEMQYVKLVDYIPYTCLAKPIYCKNWVIILLLFFLAIFLQILRKIRLVILQFILQCCHSVMSNK